MKKENGILDHTNRNIISFLNLKKKHLEKFKKCPVHQHHSLLKIQVVKELQHAHEVFKISMITQSPYHNKGLKLFTRKQEKRIITHYCVFLQVMNQ